MATAPKLPVVLTDEVFHIGSLNTADKARHFSSSLEGHCLSVSHCPEAWRAIAKLGGNPLWTLTKPQGVFLDVLKVARSKKLRRVIEAWGADRGYCERQERWKSWNTDEDGEWRYMLSETEENALAEAECQGVEEGPDGGPAVERVEVLIGTPSLCSRLGMSRMNDMDAFEFLALVWADDTQPQLDGVWWREIFAPESLSAPRAGIFPSRIPGWTAKEVSFSEVEDDDCEQRLTCRFLPDKGSSIT